MTWLPIVERELRVAARKSWTYWLRFAAALAVLLFFVCILIANHDEAPEELSQEIFGITTGVVGVACLFSGVFQTADCLSEEKREGTMGLLFLTDLRGYDIVLGKLAAGSLRMFYALLSALPIVALPLMMGGLSGAQFCRTVLVLLAALFFSLGLGLAVSAVSRESRQVIALTIFLILTVTALIPAINGVLNVLGNGSDRLIRPLLWPSLGYTFARSFDELYELSSGVAEFWGSLSVVLAMALVFLLLACVIIPRAWQEKGEVTRGSLRKRFWRWVRYGGAKQRARMRVRRLSTNPFEWLARRDRSSQIGFWVLGFPILTLWLILLVGALGRRHGPIPSPGVAMSLPILLPLAFGLALLFKCVLATEASRRLNEDRRSGALELLLVSPLKERNIIAGQRKSLYRQFGLPLLLLIALLGTMVWFSRSIGNLWVMLIVNMVGLVADFIAISWAGMWEGLRAKNHGRAVLAALARILFPRWVLFFAIGESGGFDSASGSTWLLYWCGAGLVNDLFWAWRARRRLHRLFRVAAAGLGPRKSLKRFFTLPRRAAA